MSARPTVLEPVVHDARERLRLIVETMREMSRQTDPQAMVRAYGTRMRRLHPTDRMVSLSRRGLEPPSFRITRSSMWKDEVDPWKQKDQLPILEWGFLGDLLYSGSPQIIDQLDVPDTDPAVEYFAGMQSLMAIPLYDQGSALNMVVMMRAEAGAFDHEKLPDIVWQSNLFGRATHNLVLAREVKKAYDAVDQEMRVVADIQRSLLPSELPTIPTMGLAAYYQTAHRAGGDYYDFFPLPGGKWGILIADVSGHGTPAAVLMAVTHTIAHTHPGESTSPADLLNYVNHHLSTRYTVGSSTFVTAFYGIYDPSARTLRYACAGHNPPRLKRCLDGTLKSLDGVGGVPLGIMAGEVYDEKIQQLQAGDQIIFYTDGITEASNPDGELFGLRRLDESLEWCPLQASDLLNAVLDAVERFTDGHPAEDDRTLLVAKIS